MGTLSLRTLSVALTLAPGCIFVSDSELELKRAELSVDSGEPDGDDTGEALATDDDHDGHAPMAEGGDDCDDHNAAVNPDADELCNTIDDDCDNMIDEDDAVDADTWYADDDEDGYGDPDSTTTACGEPSGYTDDTSDCDDHDATINVDGTEVCDGEDNDCDGDVDEDATDAGTWYVDSDGDGYGDASGTTYACDQPPSYADNTDDCDDDNADAHPGGMEVLGDDADGDCDGDGDAFAFFSVDTRGATDMVGPRLDTEWLEGEPKVYLSWAAETCDDGSGTEYDCLTVLTFDADDLDLGETSDVTYGESSDIGTLGKMDFDADDDYWVWARSILGDGTRSLHIDAASTAGSLLDGVSWTNSSSGADFDMLQIGVSEYSQAGVVGCSDRGTEAALVYVSHTAGGSTTAAVHVANGGLAYNTCEFDAYSYYLTLTREAEVLDYYTFSSGGFSLYSSASHTGYRFTDIERSFWNGYNAWVVSNDYAFSAFSMFVYDTATGDLREFWEAGSYTILDVDGGASPSGLVYACGVTELATAQIIYSDPLVDSEATHLTVDTGLSSVDECALTITEDSMMVVAFRSGDEVVYGYVEVP